MKKIITISIDKDAFEKAKSLGLHISTIVNLVLMEYVSRLANKEKGSVVEECVSKIENLEKLKREMEEIMLPKEKGEEKGQEE